MKYNLQLTFDSKYDEKAADDIAEMCSKFMHWAILIQQENNSSSKHLGLHAELVNISVELVNSSNKQRYDVHQDGPKFYDDQTGACLFHAHLLVRDFDLDAAKKAREQFMQYATSKDWVIRFV